MKVEDRFRSHFDEVAPHYRPAPGRMPLLPRRRPRVMGAFVVGLLIVLVVMIGLVGMLRGAPPLAVAVTTSTSLAATTTVTAAGEITPGLQIEWERVDTGLPGQVTDLVSFGGQWWALAVSSSGDSSASVLVSDDALVWEQVASPSAFDGSSPVKLAAGPNGLLAIGVDRSTFQVWESANGINWTQIPIEAPDQGLLPAYVRSGIHTGDVAFLDETTLFSGQATFDFEWKVLLGDRLPGEFSVLYDSLTGSVEAYDADNRLIVSTSLDELGVDQSPSNSSLLWRRQRDGDFQLVAVEPAALQASPARLSSNGEFFMRVQAEVRVTPGPGDSHPDRSSVPHTEVLTSQDGFNWQPLEAFRDGFFVEDMAWYGQFVAIGFGTSSNLAWTSLDGANWTGSPLSGAGSLTAISGGEAGWVTTGTSDVYVPDRQPVPRLWTSVDGTSWIPTSLPDALTQNGAFFSDVTVAGATVVVSGSETTGVGSDPTPVLWVGRITR